MTLRSGTYHIKNERTRAFAALENNNDRSQLIMMIPRLSGNTKLGYTVSLAGAKRPNPTLSYEHDSRI